MKKSKSINILRIIKILQSRGYKISKKNRQTKKDFLGFYYTFLASIFLISFFYLLPYTLNFYNNIFATNKIIINESNKNFTKVLEGKKIELKKNEKQAEFKDLYFDVFDIDINEQDTVRLSASTIKQLFEDENYNLEDIRKNKIVKPINIDLLPSEIKSIENTKKRKELFIQIILPLILEENKKIKLERKTLFSILNKNINSKTIQLI